MPALWQASERPMFVRTVWVGGVRHAILNDDDPLLRRVRARGRPLSSVSNDPGRLLRRFRSSRLSHGGDRLEECFRKLHLVIGREGTSPAGSRDEPVERLNLDDIATESEEELVLKACAQPLYEVDTTRAKFNSLCVEMRPPRSTKLTAANCHEKKDDLSERVLQWLDLAGKIDLLTPDPDNSRIAQPRHSCPEIQKRISHQFFVKRTPEKSEPKIEPQKCDESAAKVKREFDIDPPSGVLESYARQSRHARSRPTTHKQRPREPAAPPERPTGSASKPERCPEMDANLATRRQVASEIYDVERQYAALLGRKGAGSTEASGRQIKRQVHIFMPPLPKKPASPAASRPDSLLSQASV